MEQGELKRKTQIYKDKFAFTYLVFSFVACLFTETGSHCIVHTGLELITGQPGACN